MPVAKGGSLIRGNDAARFASKLKQVGDCLEFHGAVNDRGYGKFMTGPAGDQRNWIAHRYAFFIATGLEPVVVRHRCDNPRCVRVDHLQAGTQLDNVHDAMDRGRRIVVLDESMVRELRRARAAGESVRALATSMGVGYEAAIQAASGRTWRHVQ